MALFSKHKRRLIVLYFIIILILILLFHIRIELWYIFTPFVWSMVLAYILNPIVNMIQGKKVPRSLSIIIVYLLLIGGVTLLGWSIIPAIINETKNFMTDMPDYVEQFQSFVLRVRESSESQLPQGINDVLNNNINRIENSLMNSMQNISLAIVDFFSRILNIVMIPVITYYFLKDKEYFTNLLIRLIPKKWRSLLLEMGKDTDKVIGGFIRGRVTVAAFVGVFIAIGLRILGVKYALIIGIIAGILDIIPYFGPVIGAFPAVLIALLQDPMKALWVAVLFIIVQQVEGDIIAPKVIGSSVGLHPVTIILSLLLGGSFLGIIGMIISVPVAATIKVVGKHVIDYIVTANNKY